MCAWGGYSDLQPELLTVAGQRWTFTTLPPDFERKLDPWRRSMTSKRQCAPNDLTIAEPNCPVMRCEDLLICCFRLAA